MKKIYILALASLVCTATNVRAEEGTTEASVKMTYVNMDEPTKSFGEIVEGETAMSGYNKITQGGRGDAVEFGNTGWGVNYIAYLQVDASAINANIKTATLTFEASGSTDSKRTTSWGVGYNNSTWSSTMTYESAIRGIITMGDVKWTTTKAADTFEELSFDISEALKKSSNGVATILVYETAAAGGYLKNPKVEVSWTTETTYNVTFTETNGIAATITMDGNNVTNGVSLANGTYEFTATATGYQDYEGSFTVADADLNVEFAMEPKPTWNYIVKNNVNDEVKTGTCLEGLSATVPFSRYILAADGIVWMKDAINKEYHYTFTPDVDNYETTLEYTATAMNGVYFVEGEDIEGMTEVTGANANIRCSNAAGGYAEEAVSVCTLKPGKYKLAMGVWGNAGATFIVKAGEKEIVTASTEGYWYEKESEIFTLDAETVITFEGAESNKPLDYILIYEAKEIWNFTVKNNVNDEVKEGTCMEGLSASVPFSRYIIAADGTVWQKDAINKEYNYTVTPDANNYEAILEYTATDMKGVYFVEGEDIEGMTVVTGGNANVRCSNAAGGYAEEAVAVYTLQPGTYKVKMGVWGNAGATLNVKAGEETILSAETQGWWFEAETEEAFTIATETALTFEGGANNKPLDYILIIDAASTAVEAVEAANADGKWYNLQGVQIAAPTQGGLYIHNGKKVIVK